MHNASIVGCRKWRDFLSRIPNVCSSINQIEISVGDLCSLLPQMPFPCKFLINTKFDFFGFEAWNVFKGLQQKKIPSVKYNVFIISSIS